MRLAVFMIFDMLVLGECQRSTRFFFVDLPSRTRLRQQIHTIALSKPQKSHFWINEEQFLSELTILAPERCNKPYILKSFTLL